MDIGMGGSRRVRILAWTGSMGRSSMTRVGGEHLSGEHGQGGRGFILRGILIGHATRTASTGAGAGAFPGFGPQK